MPVRYAKFMPKKPVRKLSGRNRLGDDVYLSTVSTGSTDHEALTVIASLFLPLSFLTRSLA